MNFREALLAIQKGQKLDQKTILLLRDEGLIEVAEVTHMQSPGREFIATILTAEGLQFLEAEDERANPTQREPIPELKAAGTSIRAGGGVPRKRWDVFISHASEDKEQIARPLAEALKKHGYEVWYDDFSLKLGDSLREKIDRGLAESRFGVVILSKHFFTKHWPKQELNALAAVEVGGENVILPIWHGVTYNDVVGYSPILADRKAVSTAEEFERIVEAIESVVNPPLTEGLQNQLQQASDDLQEYRCPFCQSPLTTRASVPLSEDGEGTYETFECGYAQIDGCMERPCPSDPKFPKLEDYEFHFQEIEGDSHWKWTCFAIGRTRESRALQLLSSHGRTKEEARKRVEDSYRHYAKPWR